MSVDLWGRDPFGPENLPPGWFFDSGTWMFVHEDLRSRSVSMGGDRRDGYEYVVQGVRHPSLEEAMVVALGYTLEPVGDVWSASFEMPRRDEISPGELCRYEVSEMPRRLAAYFVVLEGPHTKLRRQET